MMMHRGTSEAHTHDATPVAGGMKPNGCLPRGVCRSIVVQSLGGHAVSVALMLARPCEAHPRDAFVRARVRSFVRVCVCDGSAFLSGGQPTCPLCCHSCHLKGCWKRTVLETFSLPFVRDHTLGISVKSGGGDAALQLRCCSRQHLTFHKIGRTP